MELSENPGPKNIQNYLNRDRARRSFLKNIGRPYNEWLSDLSSELAENEPGEFDYVVVDMNIPIDMVLGRQRVTEEMDTVVAPTETVYMVEKLKRHDIPVYHPSHVFSKMAEVTEETSRNGEYEEPLTDVARWLSGETDTFWVKDWKEQKPYREKLGESIPENGDTPVIASYSDQVYQEFQGNDVEVAIPRNISAALDAEKKF